VSAPQLTASTPWQMFPGWQSAEVVQAGAVVQSPPPSGPAQQKLPPGSATQQPLQAQAVREAHALAQRPRMQFWPAGQPHGLPQPLSAPQALPVQSGLQAHTPGVPPKQMAEQHSLGDVHASPPSWQ
jgi:hypothetical protein